MLHLILGRSGFGKTHYVQGEIVTWVRQRQSPDDVCYLLVPEQVSFETERSLVRALGEQDAACVRVLSFTRLYETLMKSHASRPLSNGAKIMLMSRALEELSDQLTLFRSVSRADTVESLLDAAAECRMSAVSAQMLSQAADHLPDGTLRQKTAELGMLLETYEALSSACGSDPEENLMQLARFLREHRPLEGTVVFADGFKGFTAPEMQVLSALMSQAQELSVTLCTDRDRDDTGGMDRFSATMETARRLKKAAADVGCAVAPNTLLMTPHRFKNEALEVLEATAFTSEQLDPSLSDAVTLKGASDIYEECNAVAQTIRRLMRRDGYRAREIAVVARNMTEYIGVLDVALEQAEIPFYLDRRAPIAPEGIVTAVLAALKIATGAWRTESLLQLMKTGLLGFSVSSAARLENYVYIWNITGSQFKTAWEMHPRGFASAPDERDKATLSHLNRLRRRLVKPLFDLSEALEGAVSGEQFAKAVYRYIHAARIDRMVTRQIRRLQLSGEPALAEHVLQVWAALMSLLDDMVTVLESDRIDAVQAVELLRAAAAKTDIGAIPQSLDAVQIGAADRIRFASPRAVFVLGANEGIFPVLPSSSGVLTDRERRTLIEAGVPFEDDSQRHAGVEQFLAYSALSAASERVFISYTLSTPDGERGEMSSICRTALAHLPWLKAERAVSDDGSDIETAEQAFERMAEGFRARTPLSRALYALLWSDERYRGRLQTMSRIAEDAPVVFKDSDAAKRFFGDRMVLSASRVERYHQCRFAYFCQYGIKALPLRSAELGAIEFGTLTHYCMEHTLPVYIEEGIKTVTKSRCFADAKTVSERFVEEEMGGLADKPERFRYLLGRLQGVCGNFLWQAVRELSQSHFVPVDYELDISLHSDDPNAVEPMVFTLPDGAQVTMIGKVDRVDVYNQGDKRYVRVIDYKTGAKKFRLEDVVEGINLQMLIYMMTLWQNGASRYGEVLPAGLLYMPSKTPMIKAEDGLEGAALEKKQMKKMRMNGLLLDDEQVLRAMEPDVKGVFIPASLKKDGTLSATSSVATLAQFGALGRRAQKLLTDMAATLRDGDVDARPFVNDANDPCSFCDYRAVCGHEADDRVREPVCSSVEEVLASLEEETE